MEIEAKDLNPENSPLVALAKFIAGTLVEGCRCETCLGRYELVESLVKARHRLTDSQIATAF